MYKNPHRCGKKKEKRIKKGGVGAPPGQDTRARLFVCYGLSIAACEPKVKTPTCPNGVFLWAHLKT